MICLKFFLNIFIIFFVMLQKLTVNRWLVNTLGIIMRVNKIVKQFLYVGTIMWMVLTEEIATTQQHTG